MDDPCSRDSSAFLLCFLATAKRTPKIHKSAAAQHKPTTAVHNHQRRMKQSNCSAHLQPNEAPGAPQRLPQTRTTDNESVADKSKTPPRNKPTPSVHSARTAPTGAERTGIHQNDGAGGRRRRANHKFCRSTTSHKDQYNKGGRKHDANAREPQAPTANTDITSVP